MSHSRSQQDVRSFSRHSHSIQVAGIVSQPTRPLLSPLTLKARHPQVFLLERTRDQICQVLQAVWSLSQWPLSAMVVGEEPQTTVTLQPNCIYKSRCHIRRVLTLLCCRPSGMRGYQHAVISARVRPLRVSRAIPPAQCGAPEDIRGTEFALQVCLVLRPQPPGSSHQYRICCASKRPSNLHEPHLLYTPSTDSSGGL